MARLKRKAKFSVVNILDTNLPMYRRWLKYISIQIGQKAGDSQIIFTRNFEQIFAKKWK